MPLNAPKKMLPLDGALSQGWPGSGGNGELLIL